MGRGVEMSTALGFSHFWVSEDVCFLLFGLVPLLLSDYEPILKSRSSAEIEGQTLQQVPLLGHPKRDKLPTGFTWYTTLLKCFNHSRRAVASRSGVPNKKNCLLQSKIQHHESIFRQNQPVHFPPADTRTQRYRSTSRGTRTFR